MSGASGGPTFPLHLRSLSIQLDTKPPIQDLYYALFAASSTTLRSLELSIDSSHYMTSTLLDALPLVAATLRHLHLDLRNFPVDTYPTILSLLPSLTSLSVTLLENTDHSALPRTLASSLPQTISRLSFPERRTEPAGRKRVHPLAFRGHWLFLAVSDELTLIGNGAHRPAEHERGGLLEGSVWRAFDRGVQGERDPVVLPGPTFVGAGAPPSSTVVPGASQPLPTLSYQLDLQTGIPVLQVYKVSCNYGFCLGARTPTLPESFREATSTATLGGASPSSSNGVVYVYQFIEINTRKSNLPTCLLI